VISTVGLLRSLLLSLGGHQRPGISSQFLVCLILRIGSLRLAATCLLSKPPYAATARARWSRVPPRSRLPVLGPILAFFTRAWRRSSSPTRRFDRLKRAAQARGHSRARRVPSSSKPDRRTPRLSFDYGCPIRCFGSPLAQMIGSLARSTGGHRRVPAPLPLA
jgi:hypothetical protein